MEQPTYLILTLVPYPYGGGESFMYQTITWMIKAGFRCVWVSYARKTRDQKKKITIIDGCIFHTFAGYPEDASFEEIVETYHPDVVHLQGPIVYLALPFLEERKIPTLVGFHFWNGILNPTSAGGFDNHNILQRINTQKNSIGEKFSLDAICQKKSPSILFYVASDFINQVITSLGGHKIPNVIYPSPPDYHFKVCEYDPTDNQRRYITIININRGKGGDIFYDIVKGIKDLPFLAICNEANVDTLDDDISKEISSGHVTTYTNIKDIYAQTRLLLVPSHVDETFSRVAYEGAANGIPILTTGTGFVKTLLGEAGIYLSHQSQDWITAIRKIYYQDDELQQRSLLLKKQVKAYEMGEQEKKLVPIIQQLLPYSPRRNIMLFVPWCDQGLGIQGKLYSKLLRQAGYQVHIFSFLSYFCIDTPLQYDPYNHTWQQDNTAFQQESNEWTEYDSIYYSYNTREEVTCRELRQFIKSRHIGLCLIPEICYLPIFEKVKVLKSLHVRCYAIPNIETCRQSELHLYDEVFDKILCNTKICQKILSSKNILHLEYIGHCYPPNNLVPGEVTKLFDSNAPTRFLHVSGYNGMTRKQTLVVLEAFKQARQIAGNKVELTVTFSKNIPPKVYEYIGDNSGILVITQPLSHAEILNLYAQHHVSIQVGSHEGLGLGFYESLSCGTPVISLDCAPHNEIIINDKTGWLLPIQEIPLPDNDEGLVKAAGFNSCHLTEKIIYLANHPQAIQRLIPLIIQEGRKKWSPETFITRLINALES